MGDNKHTMSDLYQMQSLPLSAKIRMTEYRIRQWVEAYGEDGVYVSFSGGKDSTVLLDIVRNRLGYKNIPAVFVDVPTQYPELKAFAKNFAGENLVVLKPKISFMEVCKKYGFPLISKEVSQTVYYAKKYLEKLDCKNKILTEQNRTEQNRTEQNRTEQNRHSVCVCDCRFVEHRQENQQTKYNVCKNKDGEYP